MTGDSPRHWHHYIIMQLNQIKTTGRQLVAQIIKSGVTTTQPGSIKHLLWGSQPSRQSVVIKFGRVGEELSKQIITSCPKLELLVCGVRDLGDIRADVDLVWLDHERQTLYYRELKGNIEMDTEKVPAMLHKITHIVKPYFKETYPDYDINCGVLNWSVYSPDDVPKKNQRRFTDWKEQGVQLDTFSDFLSLVGFTWERRDFTDYWLELGSMFNDVNSKIQGTPTRAGVGIQGTSSRGGVGIQGTPTRAGVGIQGTPARAGVGILGTSSRGGVGILGTSPICEVHQGFRPRTVDTDVLMAAEGLMLLSGLGKN